MAKVTDTELYMFCTGKKQGMEKMLLFQFMAMLPSAAISGFFLHQCRRRDRSVRNGDAYRVLCLFVYGGLNSYN